MDSHVCYLLLLWPRWLVIRICPNIMMKNRACQIEFFYASSVLAQWKLRNYMAADSHITDWTLPCSNAATLPCMILAHYCSLSPLIRHDKPSVHTPHSYDCHTTPSVWASAFGCNSGIIHNRLTRFQLVSQLENVTFNYNWNFLLKCG